MSAAIQPNTTICGSNTLAFAHSSNINLMPSPHVSTILREYITLVIVGFRRSLLFPAHSSAIVKLDGNVPGLLISTSTT